MLLTKMVEVDDARVAALTPEAFRLVLEARGWGLAFEDAETGRAAWSHPTLAETVTTTTTTRAKFERLADAHHNGSTYAAFAEVERVQALLGAVKAAERGEWGADDCACAYTHGRSFKIEVSAWGLVVLAERLPTSMHIVGEAELWPDDDLRDPVRAAREARAQLPRLVRIICGLGGE